MLTKRVFHDQLTVKFNVEFMYLLTQSINIWSPKCVHLILPRLNGGF